MIKLFKKLTLVLFVLFFAVSAWADSALQVDFILAGYRHPTTDKVLSGGKIYTFLDGTSTLSALWTGKDKGGTATNPVILDSSGKAEIFGDNIYKFEIYDSDDVLIETLNGLQYKASIATTKNLEIDYGCDLPTALAAIGTVDKTTIDVECDCIIAEGTSETITDNILLNIKNGGSFDGVAGGLTETLNYSGTDPTAGGYQTYGENLTVLGLLSSNPNWHGFLPGSSDSENTAAFQASIDSVESNEGTVFVPNGVYSYGTTGVTRPFGVDIMFESLQGTDVTYTGTGKALDCTLPSSISDRSRLTNIRITCSTTATDAIYVNNVQDLIIDNPKVNNYTNGGDYGIHFETSSHQCKVLGGAAFGEKAGIYLEGVLGTRNNNITIDKTLVFGGIDGVLIFENNNTQISAIDYNPPTVADTSTRGAVTILDCSNTSIDNVGYFEPQASQTTPHVVVGGNSTNTTITNSWFGITATMSDANTTAAIVIQDTAETVDVSHNRFTGSSGGRLVRVESGTTHNFSDNLMASTFLSFEQPAITKLPGTEMFTSHEGLRNGTMNDDENFVSFRDEFFSLSNWDITFGDLDPVISTGGGGVIQLTTPATINNTSILRSYNTFVTPSRLPVSEFSFKVNQLTDTSATAGFFRNATTYVYFIYDSSVDGNWHIESNDAGSATNGDSGVVADTEEHTFKIEESTTGVNFYIDGVDVGSITTNINGSNQRLYFSVETLANVAKTGSINWVKVYQQR